MRSLRLSPFDLRASVVTLVIAAALTAVGCSSPSQPSPAPPAATLCTYSVSSSGLSDLSASAGSASITVTTTAGCAWTATSSEAFATIVQGSSGNGSGTVQVNLDANTNTGARSSALVVAGATLTLTQRAAGTPPPPPAPPPSPCTFSVSPTAASFESAGGTAAISVRVTSGSNCTWSATPQSSFISLAGGATGTDAGQVTIALAPNTGGTRTGSVSIAGQTVTVAQAAGTTCVTGISPSSVPMPALGGSATLAVSAPSTCAWVASTIDSFLSVPSSAKVGDASVTITVAKNTVTSPRTGSVSVGSRSASITQAAFIEPGIVFSFVSQNGDYVGGGQTRRFVYTSSAQITTTLDPGRRSVGIRLPFADGSWSMNLAAPSGGVLSAGSVYNNAARWPFQDANAGLDVGGDGRGCNQLGGRFLIAELVVTNGTIQRLHAVAEQHCEYRSAAMVADLWIDADGSTVVPPASLPAPPSSPSTFLNLTGDAGDFRLNGRSLSYTLQNSVFLPRASANRITVLAYGNDGSLSSLTFEAPGPSRPVVGVTYDNAARFATTTAPGLDVSVANGGCSASTGTFRILELLYGPDGPAGDQLLRLRATFESRCTGSTAAVRGEVYIVANPWH